MTKRVVVVGGGLSGLAVAVGLAQAGRDVVVLERSAQPGGRALSSRQHGYTMNFGPRAVYQAGRAWAILQRLGVRTQGRAASGKGGVFLQGELVHPLPSSVLSMWSSRAFRPSQKMELSALILRMKMTSAASVERMSIRDWVTTFCKDDWVRRFVMMLVRLSTYIDAPDVLSAGPALKQVVLALDGVAYLDGGWQALVDSMLGLAARAGVTIRTGAAAARVQHGARVESIAMTDGTDVQADDVVLACSPSQVSSLVPGDSVAADWAARAIPARVACLDVALSRLPRGDCPVALGMDEPLYYSVHSTYAKLAPDGGAVIHLAKYLDPVGHGDASGVAEELEALLDRLQPDWQKHLVQKRFLPQMVVCHDVPRAGVGGLHGRAPVAHPEIRGLYLTGDWVGDEGLLLDAGLTSGSEAVRRILHDAS